MAIVKNKHINFSLILVCLIVVSPISKAQLGGLGGILSGPSVLNTQGLLGCSINGSVSSDNATSIPPFPNAGVQLQCGGQNVSSTTTSASGVFVLPTNILPISLSTLLSNCRIVVTTPLATCNVSLPAVNLSAPLSLVGTTISNGLNIIELTAGRFIVV